MNMTDRRRILVANSKKGHNLPSGFQEVEYIRKTDGIFGDNSSPFNTIHTGAIINFNNFITSGDTKIEIVCRALPDISTSTTNNYFFGRYQVGRVQCGVKYLTEKSYSYILAYNNFTQNVESSINCFDWLHIVTTNKLIVNNQTLLQYEPQRFTNSKGLALFGQFSPTGRINLVIHGDVKYIKGYSNGVDCDLYAVPCYRKSDGEIGMYDLIDNIFYSNVGYSQGHFEKGADVN